MDTEEVAEELYRLQTLIAEEDDRAEQFRKENIRRRHNYIPFIVELLKILAKEGKLVPLVRQVRINLPNYVFESKLLLPYVTFFFIRPKTRRKREPMRRRWNRRTSLSSRKLELSSLIQVAI